jgi:CheY-like chemotaxis protein
MKNVLVIEDIELIRNSLRRILKRLGPDLNIIFAIPLDKYPTFQAAAQEIIKENGIVLILLDVELLGKAGKEIGFEIAKAIKEVKNIPIILMSGNTDALKCQNEFEKYQDYLQFVDECIEKPFQIENLNKLVGNFLKIEVPNEGKT